MDLLVAVAEVRSATVADFFDPGSQIGVSAGKAAAVVGGQRNRHFVPPDVDVGMMVGDLCDQGDTNDKTNCFVEIGKRVRRTDDFAIECPPREVVQELVLVLPESRMVICFSMSAPRCRGVEVLHF
jgi:hypothetical protein